MGLFKKKEQYRKIEPQNVSVQSNAYIPTMPQPPIQEPVPQALPIMQPEYVTPIQPIQIVQPSPKSDDSLSKKIKRKIDDLQIEIKVKQEVYEILSSLV